MAITKIANDLLSGRYADPTNELVVNYINSGEAQGYGLPLKELGVLTGASTVTGSVLGGLRNRARLGGAIGAGLGLGLAGTGALFNANRKRKARNVLDSGDNRRLLNSKLKEISDQGVNIKNNNALNGYLNRQLKG